MSILSEAQVQTILRENPEWHLDSGKLVREWKFPDFLQAIAFVNRIAQLAESANHHPDIDIRYNKVRLGLISHDAGGITERDAMMAVTISRELR